MTAKPVYDGPERRWVPDYLAVGPVEIPYVAQDKAIQTIDRSFHDRAQIRVAFCNANTMLKAIESKDYAETLGSFLVLNDGIGVDVCSVMFEGRSFKDNLNGTDFIPELLGRSSMDLRIYLLGGAPGVAEAAAQRMIENHPRHTIVGTHHGFFSDDETGSVLAAINAQAPDLLLVAMGNPRQEEFIAATHSALNVPVLMGIGALLDLTAGKIARAPRLFRTLRAEWLFRLLQQPKRLGRRYTVDLAVFLLKVTQLRMKAAQARDRKLAVGAAPARPTTANRRLRPGN